MPSKIIIDSIKNTYMETSEEKVIQEGLKYLQELFPNKLNFSVSETAKILGLGQDFIRRQISAGRIKANKFGDRYLINIFELNKLLIQGT